jgi:hypothetical protein
MFNFQAQVFRNFDVICMKLRSPVSGNGDRNDAQIIPFQVFFSLHIFTLTPCIKINMYSLFILSFYVLT